MLLRSRGNMPIHWHDEANERSIYLTCLFDYDAGQQRIDSPYPESSVEPIRATARIKRFICDKIVAHTENGDNEYEPDCGSFVADDAIVSYRLTHNEEQVARDCAAYWTEMLAEAVCEGV